MASLLEGIESHEQSVRGDLPLASDLALVLMVSLLELSASVQSSLQFVVSFLRLFTLDEGEDFLTIDKVLASVNNGIADLSDEYDKSRWSVVVLGVGPDQENGVHDWDEQFLDIAELLRIVGQLLEQAAEGLQVQVVVVGLDSSHLDLLLKLGEGTSVSGLVLLEELQHLLDAFAQQLLADEVQVVGLVLPESQLDSGVRVLAALQGSLRVLLENILDLLLPVRNSLFQVVSLVLGRGLLRRNDVIGRQRQLGSTLHLTQSHVGVRKETVELVHEVF